MPVMRLKGLNKVTVKLASGKRVTYWYAWKGGPRLEGEPGTPEFIASFTRAVQARKQPSKDNLGSLVGQFRSSPEFGRLSASTQSEWRRWLARIETAKIASLPIAALDEKGVKRHLLAWRDTYADRPRTADYGAQVLSRVLSWSVRRGLIETNAMEGAETLYRSNRADQIWTPEDLDKLAEHASPQVMRAVRLACLTGLRRADLIALTWEHIGDHGIRLPTQKTGKVVDIPLLAETRALLGTRKTGHVLLSSRNQPWSADGLESLIWRAKQKAGITLHLHDARGTFATRLRMAGLKASEIAGVMGWEEKRVERLLATYVDQSAVVRSLAARLNKKGAKSPK